MHNHITRGIKPLGGGCPACDGYHRRTTCLDPACTIQPTHGPHDFRAG